MNKIIVYPCYIRQSDSPSWTRDKIWKDIDYFAGRESHGIIEICPFAIKFSIPFPINYWFDNRHHHFPPLIVVMKQIKILFIHLAEY
jgi:hypothetical protein